MPEAKVRVSVMDELNNIGWDHLVGEQTSLLIQRLETNAKGLRIPPEALFYFVTKSVSSPSNGGFRGRPDGLFKTIRRCRKFWIDAGKPPLDEDGLLDDFLLTFLNVRMTGPARSRYVSEERIIDLAYREYVVMRDFCSLMSRCWAVSEFGKCLSRRLYRLPQFDGMQDFLDFVLERTAYFWTRVNVLRTHGAGFPVDVIDRDRLENGSNFSTAVTAASPTSRRFQIEGRQVAASFGCLPYRGLSNETER